MGTTSIIFYDGTFEGFMTSVFDIYKNQLKPVKWVRNSGEQGLFSDHFMVNTDEVKSFRVTKSLVEKGKKRAMMLIRACFYSEKDHVENKLFYFIQLVLNNKGDKINDYSDSILLDLHKIQKNVRREIHRMHAFVRFQETKDNYWVCEINPDFNVLPLIGKHFKDRYPAFEWLIYDVSRNYGIFYNLTKINQVTIKYNRRKGLLHSDIISEAEEDYQNMWKQYFKSVNIKERDNPELHLRHVPKRYWKYLIEKKEMS